MWLLLTVLNAPLLCITALANRIFLVAGHGHDIVLHLGAFQQQQPSLWRKLHNLQNQRAGFN
jgi:hypothetical protein